MKLAKDLKPGDRIVLQDGETIVTVTIVVSMDDYVTVKWSDNGRSPFTNYGPDDKIQVVT